jgi:fibronectin type 3 domain-containing protein
MPYLESEDSEKIEILPKDTFAPAPPKGLISVAGQDVLSITWDANTENDLDGYRVWRREEGTAEFQLMTPEAIKENAYNDRAVKKGTTYMYIVTALDKSGNESKRSKRISDRIRERMQ